MDDGDGIEITDEQWGHIRWIEQQIHPRIDDLINETNKNFKMIEEILVSFDERLKRIERKDD